MSNYLLETVVPAGIEPDTYHTPLKGTDISRLE